MDNNYKSPDKETELRSRILLMIETVTVCDKATETAGSAKYDQGYEGNYLFREGQTVSLSPYEISRYQVTNLLYKAVMESDADVNPEPAYFTEDKIARGEKQENRPVESVTWYDAVYFCNRLTQIMMGKEHCVYRITNIERNEYKSITAAEVTMDKKKKGYRLPTEAEWEYAARGGSKSSNEEFANAWAGMDYVKDLILPKKLNRTETDSNLSEVAWYKENSDCMTHEAGLKKPNTLGLYDMSGNLWEWCWDIYTSDIPDGSESDPQGPSSDPRCLLRGGSYNRRACDCSVARRNCNFPGISRSSYGFRLTRSL